jgi:predicted RNA-binding protein with PUA-like domain
MQPSMARGHWLIKSEPSTYSFDRLTSEGKATWDGVRNYEARNNLRAMKKGDLCLFYHSTEGKAVVGVAKVTREAFQDPTTEDDFSAVEVAPVRPFARPVTLDEMRADKVLGKMMVFRKPRLSVVPVTDREFEVAEALGKRKA